jgi:hypothetical protein
MIFWLVLKLEISNRIYDILKDFNFFLGRGFFFFFLNFMVKYLNFHNSFFCIKIVFNVNGKATPLVFFQGPHQSSDVHSLMNLIQESHPRFSSVGSHTQRWRRCSQFS